MGDKFAKTFTECPVCKGKVRLFDELGKVAIANGTVGPEFHMALQAINGVVQDKNRPLHLGDKPVAFTLETDICTECGTIYAVKMARVEAEVTLPPTNLIIPGAPPGNGSMMNRTQRRHPNPNLRN